MFMANRNMTPRKQSAALKAKALWLDKKAAEGLTQDDANLALGWSNSLFGQYINGRVPMGVEAIVKTAGFLGVKPWDIDPSYATHIKTLGRIPAPLNKWSLS